MTIKEALIKTRDRLRFGYRPGSGFAALDERGCKVAANSNKAVCYSAVGAFQAAIDDHELRMQAVMRVTTSANRQAYVQLNSLSHHELLEAFEKAIAAA